MHVTISDFPANGNRLRAREIVELAQWAEQCGLDRFAVSDFPFHQDCLVQMAACLTATDRLVVESLVTTPYLRGPDQTAAAWATLAELSDGRAILGVGKGGAAPAVRAGELGFGRPEPEASVRDLIHICRTMWRGDAPEFDGAVLHTSGRRLDMAPPPYIPILVAARGPRMLAVAGELADIVHIGAPFLGVPYLSQRIDAVKRGATTAGRPWTDIEIDLTVSISLGDEASARAAGELTTAAAITWLTENAKPAAGTRRTPVEFAVPEGTVDAIHRDWDVWTGAPLPPHVRALLTDDVLRQFTVWGDPHTCAVRITELLAALPDVTGVRLKLPGRQTPREYRQMIGLAGDLAAELRDVTPIGGVTRGGT